MIYLNEVISFFERLKGAFCMIKKEYLLFIGEI